MAQRAFNRPVAPLKRTQGPLREVIGRHLSEHGKLYDVLECKHEVFASQLDYPKKRRCHRCIDAL